MRKNFYFKYNVYPDLFIDEDWCVPIPEITATERWMNDWVHIHNLQDRLSVNQVSNANGLLAIAGRLNARTIAQDLVSVQPIGGPRAILNYLDYTYSKTYSDDDPWYVWKRRRDLDEKMHAQGIVMKKFYHVFAEPMTFFTNVRVGNETRRVEQTPEQIRNSAETLGIDYWADLFAQVSTEERR